MFNIDGAPSRASRTDGWEMLVTLTQVAPFLLPFALSDVPTRRTPCTSPKNRGMMKEEPPKAFQADLFVLFRKWPHPVCLLLFRLQPSHYCVLHNSALVGSSPHVSPTSPRRESGDTWICQSRRRSQGTSSADVTHFTLFTIAFEPEIFLFFFCLRP